MGRRSRRRPSAAPRSASGAATRPREEAPARARGRERALDRLPPARRALAAYVAAAMFLALLVVLGIAILGGTVGPLIVLAYAVLGAGLLHRWATRRLTGLDLSDEDRVMQTMAGGLLILAVVLAAISAVVGAVA